MPTVFTVPEIIFHEHTGAAADVWALAVLIHMLLDGGSLLFNSAHGVRKAVARDMVLTLGKLPERWWTQWEERSGYFGEDGAFIADWMKLVPVSGKFLKIFSDRMEGEELGDLERLLRAMVAYEVVDLISAEVVRRMPGSWMGSGHQRDIV